MTTEARTIISFDEVDVVPEGAYSFTLDLSGESGCEVIEQIGWLVRSLKAPFELRARHAPVGADDLANDYTMLTVWTSQDDNADFLWLIHELGVDVKRAEPKA